MTPDLQELPEPPKPQAEEPTINLDDPAEQERIMNPDTAVAKLSWGSVTLHKPSMAMRRKIFGFSSKIANEVMGLPGVCKTDKNGDRLFNARGFPVIDSFAFGTRIGQVLNESDELTERLFDLIARLYDKPGRVSDQQAEGLANELSEKCSESDVQVLYMQMLALVNAENMQPQNPTKPGRRKVHPT